MYFCDELFMSLAHFFHWGIHSSFEAPLVLEMIILFHICCRFSSQFVLWLCCVFTLWKWLIFKYNSTFCLLQSPSSSLDDTDIYLRAALNLAFLRALFFFLFLFFSFPDNLIDRVLFPSLQLCPSPSSLVTYVMLIDSTHPLLP